MNIKSRLRRLFNKPIATVGNDAGERIASLRFSVPALRVGVLTYQPGELQTSDKKLMGKVIKLYYPPEAVSDEKFLKSLETSPVKVGSGGHEKNTNENNKDIDGWSHTVFYDEDAKAAMIAGVVKGDKEVNYVKNYLDPKKEKENKFGASALIDIYEMETKSGVTPDGQEYNAIAKQLKASHVIFSPNVRDPENKIKVTNAVVFNAAGNYKSEDKGEKMEITPESIAAIVKNAVKEELAAKNAEDRVKELEEEVKNLRAKNEAYEGKETAKEEEEEEKKKKEAENAEEEKKNEEEKEDATLENAKPTQELVKAVGTALNIDFGSKTPSFKSLAGMLGIKEDDPALRIAAVNAKYAEIVNKKPATAQNAGTVEVF